MFCIVYELLYDNYMGITWQLYVKYKVITRMAFSIARCAVFAYGQKLHARQSENKFSLCSRLISFFPDCKSGFFQGGIPILQEWIFRVGRMPCKLACKGVRPTLKMC